MCKLLINSKLAGLKLPIVNAESGVRTDRRSFTLKGTGSNLRNKCASQSGETLVEALVALIVAALAMLMLAMAIQVAAHLIDTSKSETNQYYTANTNLATVAAGKSGTMTITTQNIPGTTSTSQSVDVKVKYTETATQPDSTSGRLPRGNKGIAYERDESSS